ncbi:MAG TPA: ABC transporter permease subunit [Candidatus Anaerobutyricum stercoris]|uniref:ABC transporter permease subunit n=1 Tax=Candidatus Anaerobutyricum stercoris TaxID=2838457 RepID=A0A9D2EP44_9FIRM|nr:ABC transporter permease subunit [Candidatus Anaerobutyricum stercoris]
MRSKGKKAGSSLVLWIIGIYLLFPLFLTFLYSLFTEWMTILPKGFSLNAYVELFQDVYFWQSILRSLIISIVPIAVCTIVVLLAMYVIIVYLPGLDKIMKIVCTIPYAVQGVILPISVLGLYANAPAPFSNRVFMLACTYCIVVLPYIYQGVRNNLNAVHAPRLLEAAQMLGAGRFYTFWKIILPNIMNGIMVSAMLAMSIVFGDFVIVNTLAGNYFPTGQMYLYAEMRQSGQHASAVIVLLFFVTLMISLAVFGLQKNKKKGR